MIVHWLQTANSTPVTPGWFSLFLDREAVQVFTGANQQAAIADRRRSTEILRLGRDPAGGDLFQLFRWLDHVQFTTAADVKDLAISQDRR